MQHDSSVTPDALSSQAGFSRVTTLPAVRAWPAFWLGLMALVALAAVPRLLTYDYGLPYIEYIDEVQLYWYAQAARGLSDAKLSNLSGYPPAYIQLHVLTQQLLESLGYTGPAVVIQTLRLAAVVANLVGVVLVALAARMLAGPAAGLVAAAVWALSPLVIEWSVLAIGESLVYPLVALSIYFAAGAWLHPDRWRWAVASVLVAGLIILFEYRLVVMLLPGLAILVWRLGQRRGFDRRAWAVTALAAGAGLVVAVLAVYLLPPRYGRWMTRILTNDLWDFPLLLNHFRVTLEALFLPGVIVMGVLGSIGWWRLRRSGQPATDIRLIALLVALAVLINWLAAAVRWPADEGVRIQNVLPASLVVCVLAGTGVGLFVRAFRPGWLSAAVLVAVPLLVLIAQFPTLAGLVNDRRIPNWQVVIREWADINLNAGTVIVYGGHQRTFNPFWGGIQGRQWFDWWPTSDILEYPLDEWVEQRGMSYALIPVPQQRQLEQTEAGQALLNRMLRLRDFVHPPARREPEGIFYRLWRMQHETNIRFGDHIILTGYDQSVENVHPGESVDFTFYWNAPTTPDNNYSLFIHLVPADEYTVLAQVDGAPAVPERLTLTWDDPGETLISPTFTLNIPADVPPGDYRVMIGLYQFESGVRLPVTDGDGGSPGDAYMLARLRVVP